MNFKTEREKNEQEELGRVVLLDDENGEPMLYEGNDPIRDGALLVDKNGEPIANPEQYAAYKAAAGGEATPAGKELPKGATWRVWIRVAGTLSKSYRRAMERQRARVMNRPKGGKVKGEALGAESLTSQSRAVAECCMGWGGITDGDQPFAFTTDNVTTLFTALSYIQDQVEAAMQDHASFSAAASSGSPT